MDIYYTLIIVALLIFAIFSFIAGKAIGKRYMFEVMQSVIEKERQDAIKKSRSVLSGQFSEQISPYLPNFPVSPTEAKFLGSPIDFIAFKGLDEKNVTEIVFIEVKTGKSKLNGTEKSIRDAILNKKIRFEEYRIEPNSVERRA